MSPLVRTVVSLAWLAAASAAAEAPAVSAAWIRATPPGARTAAAYLTLTGSSVADRLLGAATSAAGTVEIHRSVIENGVMRMEPLPALAVPAGETVVLEPGGAHLMLIDLVGPLVPGTNVALSLRFAKAGTVALEVPVVDARADPRAH